MVNVEAYAAHRRMANTIKMGSSFNRTRTVDIQDMLVERTTCASPERPKVYAR